MRVVCLLVLACGACSGLESLHGVCGDGVVDPGEDCDSGPSCRACSIECAADPCPDGYACGVDKLCHAPGGSFLSNRPAGTHPLPVFGFGLTDTDGDHYDDVVGLSKSSMTTLHGDSAGTLERQDTTIIPTIQGPPSVTHIDHDKTLDLVIPTFDGLVGYTSPFGVMSPLPFPIELPITESQPKPITTLSLGGSFVAIVVNQGGMLGIATVDAKVKDSMMGAFSLVCTGLDPSQVTPELIDHYDVAGATPSHVIAIATAGGKVCTIEMGGAAHLVISTATLVAPTAQNTPPLFARLGASSCPSLIVVDGAGVVTEYPGTGSAGSCGLSATTRALPRVQGTAPIGRVPLVPPLAGVGADALAYPGGIASIGSVTPTPTMLYSTVRGFATVVATDLDGDGDLDAIASSGIDDDLEVVYRYGTGAVGDPAGFLSINVDTVSVPKHLVTGDFDGDGVGDVVYVEALAGFQRLMVAFGGHDQIHAPVVVSSSFNAVITSALLQLANAGDPTGTKVDDLFVLDSPTPPGTPPPAMLLTILAGSPQRTLIPFYDPRPLSKPTEMSFGFSGAVSGNFSSAPSDDETYQQLLAIERFYSPTATSRLWLMTATNFGAVIPVTKVGVETTLIGDCVSAPPGQYQLCAEVSQYVPWRPDAHTHDVVFGLDQSTDDNILVLDPQNLATPAHQALVSLVGPGLVPHSSYLADIDGDGVMERMISYAPKTGVTSASTGAIVRCTYTNGTLDCSTLDIPELAGWSCLDAAPARIVDHQRFDPLPPADAPQQLAMLCHDTGRAAVFRVSHDADGFHAQLILPLDDVDVSELQIGDVTGDGVDDVILFGGNANGAVPVVRVYPQCTSRQIADCPPLEFPIR